MSASPEFYRPSPAAFSPPCTAAGAGAAEENEYSCRTPTPSLKAKEPATCPPAPRKPRAAACRKLRFDPGHAQAQVITLRLDELERLFRPISSNAVHARSPPNN